MTNMDISRATNTTLNTDYAITAKNTDGIGDQDETEYQNDMWSTYWGYFNTHPELKSAILMKAIWNVGKGWKADPRTETILDHISGWGKDTFDDILFNMEVCRRVGRDAFCEIIRDGDLLINLKPLDPGSIKIIVDSKGRIKRYEQVSKLKGVPPKKFKPEDIFHLSNNRLADQIHGISDIESLDKTLLADLESFSDTQKVMHNQAKPFIIFKLKTDNATKIQEIVTKVDSVRNLGQDLFIPDDEDILSYEVVQINPSQVILEWRREVTNRFYRALGLPLIIFGASGGTTESGGKMEYFAHEQIFEKDQRFLEQQIWNQLGLRIDLIPPTSMAQEILTDQSKDQSSNGLMQGLDIQPADVIAGRGA